MSVKFLMWNGHFSSRSKDMPTTYVFYYNNSAECIVVKRRSFSDADFPNGLRARILRVTTIIVITCYVLYIFYYIVLRFANTQWCIWFWAGFGVYRIQYYPFQGDDIVKKVTRYGSCLRICMSCVQMVFTLQGFVQKI